ncbi:hypothetical protein I3J27_14080 [Bradyrhizobium xenonodulans]|uniref:Uncharacterized protein n=1 Tax=Bradyrhizobium xenonodulans TaxID=2736875 RepID=A0ABY7MVB9_9BRAD|nr:hypothetical protein [Bradyrhizobium xenonodulans]WBL81489.1 hypothetical protein I3J27_14080 [Bradyrhizobium xenonodulans]
MNVPILANPRFVVLPARLREQQSNTQSLDSSFLPAKEGLRVAHDPPYFKGDAIKKAPENSAKIAACARSRFKEI